MEAIENEIGEMKLQVVTAGYPNPNNGKEEISYSENCREYEKSSNVIKRKDYGNDSLESSSDHDICFFENNGRLYVLKHGAYLATDEGDLIIKKKKVEIYRRPLSDLCLVFLQGMGMNISINLQLKLAELDIPVVFAPPVGPPAAILNSVNSSNSFLRGIQALRRNDPEIVCAGLNMLAAKTGNQAAVLNYFSKYRKVSEPDIGQQLSVSATKIKECSYSIKLLNPELADVRRIAMGLEGQAAAIYWQQITQIMPAAFGFTGRITRAAKDIVNQCLNYVYGILYGEVWRAVVKAGLDPYFGLIHGSKRDQGSLVFDLIEEFRAPFADRLVIAMMGRGFQPKMGEYGFLRSKTRKQLAVSFLKGWHRAIDWRSQKIAPSAILEKQASSLAKLFNQKGQYHAFKMRW